jgi:CRISPR-associated protein Cst2
MAFITGSLILDAPASALNNAGSEEGARTNNTVGVKKISTPEGKFAYVSAQSFRYWLRSGLETELGTQWRAAPVRRDGKIAYTDANPIEYWDDDLFGYMRAQSNKADSKRDAGASPLEKDREITRVSPFRVSTLVSISPVRIVDDFGTMTRQEGDPVPYEHQFYRVHLLGLLSLDLTCAGTFFDGSRVGFKNLDKFRREDAEKAGCTKVTVRKQESYRLPLAERQKRTKALIGALGTLTGGAKQAQHYTDLTPAVLFLAVTKNGNNPFYRMVGSSQEKTTSFHESAFNELMRVYADDFVSQVYVGWAQGFLDGERAKLERALVAGNWSKKISVAHPVEQVKRFVEELGKPENAAWFE